MKLRFPVFTRGYGVASPLFILRFENERLTPYLQPSS